MPSFRLAHGATVLCLAAAALLFATPARGQFIIDEPDVPGVHIDADGHVSIRRLDAAKATAAARARAKAAEKEAMADNLAFVSLPKAFADARAAAAAGKPVPDAVRYLGGMTQLRYVFVFPTDKDGKGDLVIAGPAEPWVVHDKAGNHVTGKRTGRPVMHLDDLAVALRTAHCPGGHAFGCAIDPDPDSGKKAEAVVRQYARASRAKRIAALKDALGPQNVRVFGAAQDSRLGFACVAADYKLKEYAIGAEKVPLPGVGHAVDSSRPASNRFWFEAAFEPLLVSPDGNSFEVRGPRLTVKSGKFSFDPHGATPKAQAWAKGIDDKIVQLAIAEPLIADLQNIADLALLSSLIRQGKIAQKTGWDIVWLLAANAPIPAAKVPVPRTADTLVNSTSGSLVAGGVSLSVGPYVRGDSRQVDTGSQLEARRSKAVAARATR